MGYKEAGNPRDGQGITPRGEKNGSSHGMGGKGGAKNSIVAPGMCDRCRREIASGEPSDYCVNLIGSGKCG